MRDDNEKASNSPLPKNLADLEGKLERAIESPFSRLFRSPLQPAEIEKAALKEIERSRKLGVNTIYVANHYSVVISPADADNLGDLISTLETDLATRIFAYSSTNNYQMNTRPIVSFVVDDELKLGNLHVIGETLSADSVEKEFGDAYLFSEGPKKSRSAAASRTPESEAREDKPYNPLLELAPLAEQDEAPAFASDYARSEEPAREPAPAPFAEYLRSPQSAFTNRFEAAHPDLACDTPGEIRSYLTIGSQPPLVLGARDRYVIGRKGEVDIIIEDPQCSRFHAELTRGSAGWRITDLGSTNGTYLNGKEISSAVLKHEDQLIIGTTALNYYEKRC